MWEQEMTGAAAIGEDKSKRVQRTVKPESREAGGRRTEMPESREAGEQRSRREEK